MRTTRNLLNGETLVLDVPDATELPPSAAISVLAQDGLELEVNSGSPDHLQHYLSVSGSTLTDEVALRTVTRYPPFFRVVSYASPAFS